MTLRLRLTLAGLPEGSVFTPSTCAAVIVRMASISAFSPVSWLRISAELLAGVGFKVAPALCLWQRLRMGEVKAMIKIKNATDVGMHRRGLLAEDQIRSVTVEAVVDTGAVRSCIPVDLKEELGLYTLRHINAQMANGQVDSVELTDAAYIDILGRVATESFLVLGGEVLIGQTALESTDLLVDCNRQRVITNPDHPNSAIIRIR